MSDAKVNSLEDWVLGWATAVGVPELYDAWIKELRSSGVGNIQALQKIAKSPDWEEFLQSFKAPLKTYLRDLGDKYKSKLLIL
jgi:hypothetical protein